MRRAVDHYITLKDDFHWGVDHKMRAVIAERERDGLEYRLRIAEDVEPIHPDWPVVYGEALYNLRSALDHLVFQLHVRRYRGHGPSIERIERMSEFPIREKPRKDKTGAVLPTDRWSDIGHLGAAERAKIEWLQPYKGWHSKRYPPRSVIRQERWALLDLERLCNADKHRELMLGNTVAVSVPVPRRVTGYGFKHEPAFGVTLERDTEIDRWVFKTAPPADRVPVKMHLFSTVGAGPPGERIQVLPHLGGMVLAIAGVIARFEPLFPRTASPVDLRRVHLVQG